MSPDSMSLPVFLVFYLGTISLISLYIYSQRLSSYSTQSSVTHNTAIYDMGQNEPDHFDNDTTNFQCAWWLPQEKRRILFINFNPVDELSWWSEEYHMTLSLAKSLTMQGFEIHSVRKDALANEHFWTDETDFHRIFYMVSDNQATGIDLINEFLRDHEDLQCKLRVLIPNPGTWDDGYFNILSQVLHEKQILLPYPQKVGTSIDYYPVFPKHAISSLERSVTSNSKKKGGKAVMIVSNDSQKDYMSAVARKLSENSGIDLHVVVLDKSKSLHFSPNLSLHYDVTRDEVLRLILKSAFLVRCGKLEVSSPLSTIALHLGTAIIDVCTGINQKLNRREIGIPYLYSVAVGEFDAFGHAVKSSLKHRFHSFVRTRSGTFDDRICAQMEDDSICSCPDEADCRSTFYIRKEDVYEELNKNY